MAATVTEEGSKEPHEMETASTVDVHAAPARTDEPTETNIPSREHAEVHHDDGGEVMEDNEDTVIY